MKSRIAIVAALPREIRPLVRGWPVQSQSRQAGFMMAECDGAVAVCAGMGRERVTHAFAMAETRGPLSQVISVGYAGGLHSRVRTGEVYWPATVIDARTGERYSAEGGSGTLVTMERVVGHLEKTQVAARWNADLADMEAATVARLARMRGLSFRALRMISDEWDEELPDMNRFTDQRGGFRELAFAGHVALRPWLVPGVIRMGRTARQASQAMAKALREVLETTE